MRKLIQYFLCLTVLLLALPSARAFSLGGPIGNGGDSWQIPDIGYGLAGDLNAPKNIGEEYRRNVPYMYYAYDANFFGFFGLAGATNVDLAYATMNGVLNGWGNTPLFVVTPDNAILGTNGIYNGVSVTLGSTNNLDSYSPDLNEFSIESIQYNNTMAALGLVDLKSIMLTALVEQMGLADPIRYNWTLHDMFQPSGTTCPNFTEFLVVQRNFDYLNSALNQVQYTPYVNDTLYYYQIFIFTCGSPPPQALALPINVDPFAGLNSPVATFSTDITGGFFFVFSTNGLANPFSYQTQGGFYSGLTRDDVAGLRYLMTTNNINTESTAINGSLLLITNKPSPVLITTLPFSLLFSQSNTNDPDTLRTNFPGLVILSVITNVAPVVTTNVTPFFTNQTVLPVFTGATNGLPQVTTLTNIYYFTNQPGPTVINYDFSQPFQTIFTLDLALFSDRAATNDAATMVGFYPGLQILKSTAFPSFIPVTNYISYLTNITGAPYQGAPKLVTQIQSINFAFVTNWVHQFGNVFTNHFYTNRTYRVRNIWITNLIGAPYPSPFVAYTNDVIKQKTNSISGDFFIFPTNWCGFDLRLALPLSTPPESFSQTNTFVYPGYNSSGSVGTNATVGGNAFGLTQMFLYQFTNYAYAVNPGICEPLLQFGTNYSTNIVTTYQYYFANIVTNHFFTNTLTTILTTNIGPCPGGSPVQLCTNITITTFNNNSQSSGDFFIPPPAWCGYSILSTQLTTVVTTTNTITATTLSTPNIGQSFTEVTITSFTTSTFLIQPFICSTVAPPPLLREGIQRAQFIRANYDSLLSQFFSPITNYYTMIKVTNSQPVKEYYRRVITRPDFLMSARDQGPGQVHLLGGGHEVPADAFFSRNLPFDQSTILTSLAGPGVIFSPTEFDFNKAGRAYFNISPSFMAYTNAAALWQWASFDASTNDPVLYPNGTDLQNLVNQIYIQVAPTTAVDGTSGVPYVQTVPFSVTGGQPPFVWAAPNISALVPGMSFNPTNANNTAKLIGTPTAAGNFNFNLQVTDSVNRTVNLNYTITIH